MRLREMAEQAQRSGCADCLFFDAGTNLTEGDAGYCRAIPPRALLKHHNIPQWIDDHLAVWPVVHVSDWCGAWMERRDGES